MANYEVVLISRPFAQHHCKPGEGAYWFPSLDELRLFYPEVKAALLAYGNGKYAGFFCPHCKLLAVTPASAVS